jgi:hypothetical protein
LYLDEFGRRLTPKEAYRQLCWKFHGKRPGKNKMEKRLRQLEEEQKRRSMSSTDTPLQSVKAMQNEQEKFQTAYLVLSKGATSLTDLPTSVQATKNLKKTEVGDNIAPPVVKKVRKR